jgi:hypothetical protein
MMMSQFKPVAAALMWAGLPLALQGQASAERRAREDAIATAAASLPRGTRVRMSIRGGTIEGRYLGLRLDTLVVETQDTAQLVPIGDVTGIWVKGRTKHATRRGAIWGFGLGTGLAIIFILRESDTCDYDCFDDPFVGGLLVGGIPGAILGSLVGTAVGAVRRPWRRLYPQH